jgi:outer membrane protein assembly factor BamE
MRRQLALACVLAASAAVNACVSIVFTPDIQQGNLVTQENVAQLKVGMSQDQVRFILGTPLVTDIFHANRWDYVYTNQPSRARTIKEERRLTLYFDKDGRLERVDGDVVPGEKKPAAAADNK